MPNSIDFRADQIQTKKIIVTGSGAGTTKLLIYGIEAQGSPVNEGLINTTYFPQTGIGGDVFLYVSGAVNTKDSATVRGTSVFGGDLVVSGSLYNGSPAPAPAIRGIYSHAEGLSTFAIGSYSHAEGSGSNAYSIASHAEGRETIAYSGYSHAEGYLTTASAYASHAEGQNTTAGNGGSHAEGFYTSTVGAYSHAQGSGSITWGIYSFAAGNRTIASGSVDVTQAAFGRFNKRDNTTSLFVVGNGTGDSDALRGDIFRAESTGQLVLSGGISHKVNTKAYIPPPGGSFDPATDTYTLTLNDYLVIVNVTAGGPFNINLPASATTPIGTTYTIRRYDGSAPSSRHVRINPNGTDLIIDSAGTQFTSAAPLLIIGVGGTSRGGCVTLTYIGNYYDSSFGGTYPTWITTSELELY